MWIYYLTIVSKQNANGSYDETLIPVHFQRAGQIRDDDLLKHLVKPMSAGVTMTCLMDCCHSGTVLDLPYRFVADGDHVSLLINIFNVVTWLLSQCKECLFIFIPLDLPG